MRNQNKHEKKKKRPAKHGATIHQQPSSDIIVAKYNLWSKLADEMRSKGKLAKAEEYFLKALEVFNNNSQLQEILKRQSNTTNIPSQIHLVIANMYYSNNRFEKAVEHHIIAYEICAENKEALIFAHTTLLYLYDKMVLERRYDRAYGYIQRLKKLGNAEAYLREAAMYLNFNYDDKGVQEALACNKAYLREHQACLAWHKSNIKDKYIKMWGKDAYDKHMEDVHGNFKMANAQIALIYENYQEIDPGYENPNDYYLSAAENPKGLAVAQHNLAYNYQHGINGPVNLKQALHYYRMAVENNHRPALKNLANIYYKKGKFKRSEQLYLELHQSLNNFGILFYSSTTSFQKAISGDNKAKHQANLPVYALAFDEKTHQLIRLERHLNSTGSLVLTLPQRFASFTYPLSKEQDEQLRKYLQLDNSQYEQMDDFPATFTQFYVRWYLDDKTTAPEKALINTKITKLLFALNPQESATAAYTYAMCYNFGVGTVVDLNKAFNYYKLADTLGFEPAKYNALLVAFSLLTQATSPTDDGKDLPSVAQIDTVADSSTAEESKQSDKAGHEHKITDKLDTLSETKAKLASLRHSTDPELTQKFSELDELKEDKEKLQLWLHNAKSYTQSMAPIPSSGQSQESLAELIALKHTPARQKFQRVLAWMENNYEQASVSQLVTAFHYLGNLAKDCYSAPRFLENYRTSIEMVMALLENLGHQLSSRQTIIILNAIVKFPWKANAALIKPVLSLYNTLEIESLSLKDQQQLLLASRRMLDGYEDIDANCIRILLTNIKKKIHLLSEEDLASLSYNLLLIDVYYGEIPGLDIDDITRFLELINAGKQPADTTLLHQYYMACCYLQNKHSINVINRKTLRSWQQTLNNHKSFDPHTSSSQKRAMHFIKRTFPNLQEEAVYNTLIVDGLLLSPKKGKPSIIFQFDGPPHFIYAKGFAGEPICSLKTQALNAFIHATPFAAEPVILISIPYYKWEKMNISQKQAFLQSLIPPSLYPKLGANNFSLFNSPTGNLSDDKKQDACAGLTTNSAK